MPIVLLPGMTLNASVFPPLPHPTIAVDFNEVAWRTLPAIADYVRLLERELAAWEVRDGDPYTLVGHSFGGMLALAWLLARPEARRRTRGVVLIATTAGPMFDVVRIRIPGAPCRMPRIPFAALYPVWNAPIVTAALKLLLSGGRLGPQRVDFRSLRFRSDLAVDLAGWRNTHWRALRGFRHAMAGFDLRGRLAEIPNRAIVLHGTRDSLFPLEVGRDLAARLPRGELRVIRGAGHALPLTHGEEVVRAIEDLQAG